jgi:thymidylate kinase
MRLAISGVEGSGKSTLVKLLHERFPKYQTATEGVDEIIQRFRSVMMMPASAPVITVIEELRKKPEAYLEFQRQLSQYRAEVEGRTPDIFCDRAHMDGAAFASLYLYGAKELPFQYLRGYMADCAARTKQTYDLILYLPVPQWSVSSEGRRRTELNYLHQFDYTLRGLYHQHGIEIHELKDKTPEGRLMEAVIAMVNGPLRSTRHDP